MQQAMSYGGDSCRVDLALWDEFASKRHVALAIHQYQDATAEEEGEFNDEEAEYDLSS